MRPVVRMIGQAHLDPVWLWRKTEGQAEALATSRSAVDRLHEYPSFHYVRGEAQVYEWVEEEAPELFAEIRELVRAGRWHIVNGMIVQPDMNLPQGESFIRQALLGKRYFQEKFGVDVRIAYCVDSFGHAGTLPQILNKCGFDYYVFMRPQAHEKDLPTQAFWWEAPDGSRVLTFHIVDSYGGPGSERHIRRALEAKPPQFTDTMCFFGVGNHGGGPTKAQIEEVLALGQGRDDIDIRFDHPQAYFDAIAPLTSELPVVADELQFHATGCYSVNSTLKHIHRQAECALLLAERMAVLAEIWTGRAPERETLRRLWHDVAFNQFHDTLAGSGIKEAEDEAIITFGRALLTSQEMANSAGRLIGARVDTSGIGSTVLLLNPFPYSRQEYVEYEPWTDRQRWKLTGWGLVDEQGQPVAHQVIEAQAAVGREDRGIDRLVFRAELPPLGYRRYRFAQGLPVAGSTSETWASGERLENDLLSVRLDSATGAIVSCLDKATGAELVGEGRWNVAQVLEDNSDTWSHGVREFGPVLGEFDRATVTVGDQSPLQASLLVERSWKASAWLQQIILRKGERELLVRNWLHWQGHWRMVKLAFDVAVSEPEGFRDVPFGAFCAPSDGAEVPLQMWLDVSGNLPEGGQAGLALLNDGKYAGDVRGSTLRLTILRCPPYAYHIPHVPGTKQRYDWVDQGLQEFTLALRPHLGGWREAGVVRRARELNLPVLPITMHAHPGELPATASIARIEGDELEMTALKPAEDGDGYIMRIADRHGYGGVGTLTWMGERIALSVKSYEVLTLRLVQRDGCWHALPCDMIERPSDRTL